MKRQPAAIAAFLIVATSCHSEGNVQDRSKYPTVTEKDLKGVVRTTLDNPEPTAAQLERRARSVAVLKSLGVPYLAGLPVTENADELEPRTSQEVADRAVAVAIAAVKGESNDHAFTQELVTQFGAHGLFSPTEQAFIDNPSPAQQELIDHAWHYEALHVLLWALGHLERLKPPNEICDVPKEVALVRDLGRSGLAEKAKARSAEELFEQADLYYHLHWSAIELRLRGGSSEALDEGVIRERHRALNWLIRYMNQSWDDVQTDT